MSILNSETITCSHNVTVSRQRWRRLHQMIWRDQEVWFRRATPSQLAWAAFCKDCAIEALEDNRLRPVTRWQEGIDHTAEALFLRQKIRTARDMLFTYYREYDALCAQILDDGPKSITQFLPSSRADLETEIARIQELLAIAERKATREANAHD